MRNVHRPAALLLAVAVVGELHAQIIPSLPPPFRSGSTTGGSLSGGSRHNGRPKLSLFFSDFSTSGFYGSYPYFPAAGNSITVISIYSPMPPIAVNTPTPRELELLRDLNLTPREPLDQPAEAPPPGIRRIGPNNRVQVPPPPPPAPPVRVNPPSVPLPNPERPADNPRDEYARLVKLGKEAFVAQEYGRAAERLRQAIAVENLAPAHFLLAQAEFAIGKYFEAVDAIYDGLRLDPDWPTSPFRPQALYAPDTDEFSEQLQRLQSALTHHPDDPVLLFLYAYHLWFDGRRNEALPLFQRAAAVAPDKAAIEKFLQAKP